MLTESLEALVNTKGTGYLQDLNHTCPACGHTITHESLGATKLVDNLLKTKSEHASSSAYVDQTPTSRKLPYAHPIVTY
jgi:hypothetical protein